MSDIHPYYSKKQRDVGCRVGQVPTQRNEYEPVLWPDQYGLQNLIKFVLGKGTDLARFVCPVLDTIKESNLTWPRWQNDQNSKYRSGLVPVPQIS